MSTVVVSDTTAYLPDALLREHRIELVSLYVSLEGEQQREVDIRDYDAFYAKLAASAESVTTSQPSVGDFIGVYEPLLDAGRDIVSIHITEKVSGTLMAATQARERLIVEGRGGERIQIVDSGSGAGGLGMVLLGTAPAVAAGADGATAAAVAAEVRDKHKLYFAVDTLEYLRRGGRIGAARALVGTALKIKPILTMGEEITPVDQVRTRSRAYAKLLELAGKLKEGGARDWVVQHVQNEEGVARLAEDCREIFGCEPLYVSEIGPVIGAHVGHGLLGVGATQIPRPD
ncbi:MAG: fatty acid kinase fatty acid binding subunit [Solirubrobacterales bacterium]|nr:fatty acid kinase fatty acid binding subunit [Solirubrobacterales bacterium]